MYTDTQIKQEIKGAHMKTVLSTGVWGHHYLSFSLLQHIATLSSINTNSELDLNLFI